MGLINSLLRLKHWQACFYIGLMQTTIASLSSWVLWSCLIQKTLFWSRPPWLLVITVAPIPLLLWSSVLRGDCGIGGKDTLYRPKGRAEQLNTSQLSPPLLFLCLLPTSLSPPPLSFPPLTPPHLSSPPLFPLHLSLSHLSPPHLSTPVLCFWSLTFVFLIPTCWNIATPLNYTWKTSIHP